ncbi:MAG: SURF1 family protein [Proteobacteria bacterium]|nr:SURF1 family protein [Pseudomonadota bacterium]
MHQESRFPWGFSLLWLAILLVMIWAGFWQMDRASQKEVIRQQMQSGTLVQPQNLTDWQNINNYQAIRTTGHYENMHFLLANQFQEGQVGFHVLTSFLTDDHIRLLVNRGWTASADIDVSVNNNRVNLTGMLSDWPRPGVQLGEQEFKNKTQQQVTYLPQEQTKVFLTQQLCHRHNCTIFNRVVKLDPEAEAGFVREWQAPMMTAARHRAYAFQWFTMSLALCLIYIYYLRKTYAIKK